MGKMTQTVIVYHSTFRFVALAGVYTLLLLFVLIFSFSFPFCLLLLRLSIFLTESIMFNQTFQLNDIQKMCVSSEEGAMTLQYAHMRILLHWQRLGSAVHMYQNALYNISNFNIEKGCGSRKLPHLNAQPPT